MMPSSPTWPSAGEEGFVAKHAEIAMIGTRVALSFGLVARSSSFSSHRGAVDVGPGGEPLLRENSPGFRRRARQLDRSVISAVRVGLVEV